VSPRATKPQVPRTLFEKIWDAHIVQKQSDATPAILYVDLHLVHEVTSAQAFTELRERELIVRAPHRTIATMDHSTPTGPTSTGGRGFTSLPVIETDARLQLDTLERNCKDTGIPLLPLGDERRGIVHVIGPELGLTRPGMTIVCGDSHTSTHGAFGALAFGIGTSQVAQVLATQCLLQNKPKTMQIRVDGQLEAGVTAKDLALALCQRLGTGGATGHVIEYTGSGIRALSMEERMTVCNMSIEMGARAGLIAPDETTFEFLRSRVRVSASTTWSKEMATWRELPSDEGAVYDALVTLDASTVAPMITYGTNPGMAMPITETVPKLETIGEGSRRDETQRALQYMGIEAGATLLGTRVEVVFIGSCTNSRLSDLRAAADVLRNRRVAPWVRMLVVPGSQAVKRAAESEGLDQIFANAGAEWRESGCSMCIAMNGDRLEAGQLAVSTSNRNFEGRQGAGGRTILASPATAAASAVTGVITDPRELDGVVA
jgi:3-isopropylmalate/(R)-2-methylmalate dehydratase large subunit